jgi:hypothetical protein
MKITLGTGLQNNVSRLIVTEVLLTVGKSIFGEKIFNEVDLKIQFGFPSWINRRCGLTNSSLVDNTVLGMMDFYYSYSFPSHDGKIRNFFIYVDFEKVFHTNIEFLVTICHELYHCMQLATGIWKITNNGYEYNGIEYPLDTQYDNAPWENEAYAFEMLVPNLIYTNKELMEKISVLLNV